MAQIKIKHPWDPGYALPEYVMTEPDGRGTFTTKWLQRGTFFDMPKSARTRNAGYALPQYIEAEPVGRGVFTSKYIPRRTVGVLAPDTMQRRTHTLSGDSLGADETPRVDPIETYGTRAADVVLVEMNRVPKRDRKLVMKRILDGIDPALIAAVNRRLAQGATLRQALKESLKEGLTREFARIGKSRSPRAGGGAVATGLGGLTDSFKKLFSGHVEAAKTVGGIACDTARHPATSTAGGAVAAGYGQDPSDVQAGIAIMSNVCGPGAGGAIPPGGGFPWVPVALVGGAALVAILLVTRD